MDNTEKILPSILVIDDDPLSLDILEAQFRVLSANIIVERCIDLYNILEYVAEKQPHLVLLDVNLGMHLSGYDICRQLSSDPRTCDIPVILLTANTTDSEEIQGFEAGAKDYIHKPYNAQILCNRVMTHVDLSTKTRLLESECQVDELTRLTNRNGWNKKAPHRLQHCARLNFQLATLFFDIDWFKPYNDVYGHDKGDEILCEVADILRMSFDKNPLNVVARIGGEEFVVILVDSSEECIHETLSDLDNKLKTANIEHPTSEYKRLTLSAGCCIHKNPILSNDISELMKIADECLHTSKNTGRNKTTFRIIESL